MNYLPHIIGLLLFVVVVCAAFISAQHSLRCRRCDLRDCPSACEASKRFNLCGEE